MMRSLITIALLLFLAVANSSRAAEADLENANRQLEEAHLLFERGETERAAEIYVSVARSGFANPSLWTNAGTAAFRSDDIGKAVLYYSRALRLDPTYDRALRSLQFVSPATNDAAGAELLLRQTAGVISPGWWALAAQISFLAVCIGLALALARWRATDTRNHWFVIVAWSLVLFVVFSLLTLWSHRLRLGGDDAVVLRSGTIVRSEPRAESTAQLELPAGTILRFTEEPRRGFVRCKLADGRTGFLSTNDIERI